MGDFSLTTFSSKGQLLQIEYALNAVNKGEMALGISAKNGVVIAVEKKVSSILVDEKSFQKIQLLTPSIGAVYAGLGPDFRILAQKARKQAQTYYLQYRENVQVQTLCRETASTVQEYTQSGGVRPFGISVLFAGCDEEGPHLFQIDPSGAFYEWKATAIGRNSKNAKIFLEKRYKDDMEIEDAIHTALLTLKEGFEGQMNHQNIEVGVITTGGEFQVLTQERIKDYLDEVE